MNNPRIFSVSEINASIRGVLEVQFPFISIAGEISNLRQPFSGHCYFTLKDEYSQIRAVLFKMQRRYLSAIPADGQKVICRGRITAYEARGEYQIIVDTIDFHGTGAMQLEFEKLKQRLAAEGLFDKETKKAIPSFPEHITIITSPQGAAIHDFIRIARTRFPQVKIAVYPVSVQGDAAAGEIVNAIAAINKHLATDVIVLCRGGGSIEDLWAFNEEKVARAIAGSVTPVVSAIGHEIDFTIADFVADLRAPTPSAAAEMILPETERLKSHVMQLQMRQIRVITSQLKHLENRVAISRQRLAIVRHPVDHLSMKLDHATVDFHRAFRTMLQARQYKLNQAERQIHQYHPETMLQLQHQKLTELHRRLFLSARSCIESRHESLSRAAGLLNAVSPLPTLARGYAIAKTLVPKEIIITDIKQVKAGSRIEVILLNGSLECRVEKTCENRLRKEK